MKYVPPPFKIGIKVHIITHPEDEARIVQFKDGMYFVKYKTTYGTAGHGWYYPSEFILGW